MPSPESAKLRRQEDDSRQQLGLAESSLDLAASGMQVEIVNEDFTDTMMNSEKADQEFVRHGAFINEAD